MTGRPSQKPTKSARNRVQLMAADGWSNARIAQCMGLARNTLAKHFAAELELGADMKLCALLELAERTAKKGNATMIKWLAERFDRARAAEAKPSSAGDADPRRAKLGKKQAAQLAAQTAEQRTSWETLLRH